MLRLLVIAAMVLLPSTLLGQFGGPFGGNTGGVAGPSSSRGLSVPNLSPGVTTPPIAGRTGGTELKSPSPIPRPRPTVIAIDTPPMRTPRRRRQPRNRRGGRCILPEQASLNLAQSPE